MHSDRGRTLISKTISEQFGHTLCMSFGGKVKQHVSKQEAERAKQTKQETQQQNMDLPWPPRAKPARQKLLHTDPLILIGSLKGVECNELYCRKSTFSRKHTLSF